MRISLVLATLVAAAASAHAFVAPELLSGEKLILGKHRIGVSSKDVAIGLGRGQGSADDPVANGAKVRVLSIEGDVFDGTYELPPPEVRRRRAPSSATSSVARERSRARSCAPASSCGSTAAAASSRTRSAPIPRPFASC
jgi:hypothetical protein